MFVQSFLKRLSGRVEDQSSENKDTPHPPPPPPNYLLYIIGGSPVAKPYRSLEEFKLHQDIVSIYKSLHLGDNTTTSTSCLDDLHLAMAVAPNIVDGSDSILVVQKLGAKPKLRRILSYFLPILQWLISQPPEAASSGSIDGTGPKVVIICASISSALAFQKSVNLLLTSKTTTLNLKTRVIFSGMQDYDVLLNSCDILITNISSATEILTWRKGRTQTPLKTRQKLKYVILEEVEDYLKTEWGAVQTIIAATSGWKNKSNQEVVVVPSKSPSAQIVISGRKWTKELQTLHLKLLGKGRKLVLYMEALSEILMLSKTHWRVDYAVEKQEKLEMLKEIITQQMSAHKHSVIACSDIETASEILQACEDAIVSSKNVTVSLNPDSERKPFELSKNAGVENRISVLTDDMITTTNISGCTYLLSFDSDLIQPPTQEPIEKKRLWYLWPSFPKLVDGKWVESEGLVAHFMMTGEEPYFLRFFKFSKILNNTFVHPHLEVIGSKLQDEELEQALICNGFELFGYCNVPATCTSRHTFNETDFETTLAHAPCYGEIEFQITDCISPSEYSGLLLAHYEVVEAGQRNLVYSFIDEVSKRSALLEEYYSSEDNQIYASSRIKGGVYAINVIENDSSTYKRVKIMGKQTEKGTVGVATTSTNLLTEYSMLDKLDVMFVDTPNARMTMNANELLHIPDEFRSWSPLYLRLILTNIRPPNQEPDYVSYQVDNAKCFLTGVTLIRAKVIGSRENTVWVNPITFEKSSFDQPQNLSSKFTKNNTTAVSNPSHEKMIIESFRGVGEKYHGHLYVDPPKRIYSAKEIFKEEIFDYRLRKGEIQWAHVDKSVAGNINPVRIRTTWGEDPWLFYGIHMKFQPLLDNLEDELNAWISAQPHQANGDDGMILTDAFFGGPLEMGSVVAVKDRLSKTWMRGLIIEVDKKEGEEDYFTIFFVDYGDDEERFLFKREELYPLPTIFVTRLPFQAIAFSLNHIRPVNDSKRWKKEETNSFLDILYPRDRNGVGIFVAATNEVEGEKFPPCCYYDAVVVLPPSTEEVGITLVKNGKAVTATDIDHFVEEFVDLLVNTTNTSSSSHCDDADDDDDDDDDNDKEEQPLNNTDVMDIVRSGLDDGTNDVVYGDDDEEEFYRKFDVYIPEAAGGKWGSAGENVFSGVMAQISHFKLNSGHGIDGNPPPPSSSSGAVSTALVPVPQNDSIRSPSLAPVSVGLLHPTVFWHQTSTQLILTVELPDIQEYSFKISLNQRSVSCKITKPPNYGFHFKLFGKVKREPDHVIVNGQQLRIKLGKRLVVDSTWKRILYDKTEKLRWLKEHPEFLKNDEDEDKGEFSEDEEFNSDYKTQYQHLLGNDDDDGDAYRAWSKSTGSTLSYNPVDDEDEDEIFLNGTDDESFPFFD